GQHAVNQPPSEAGLRGVFVVQMQRIRVASYPGESAHVFIRKCFGATRFVANGQRQCSLFLTTTRTHPGRPRGSEIARLLPARARISARARQSSPAIGTPCGARLEMPVRSGGAADRAPEKPPRRWSPAL